MLTIGHERLLGAVSQFLFGLTLWHSPVQLQVFGTIVDSVLSHVAEVWGMQLAALAAASHRNLPLLPTGPLS